MAFRAGLFLLVLYLAMAAAVSSFSFGDVGFDIDSHIMGTCNGQIGDCIDEAEEGMMSSESTRRTLAQQKFISYRALRRDRVPCNKKGSPYYNCNQRTRANPYTRGCSVITRCARATW